MLPPPKWCLAHGRYAGYAYTCRTTSYKFVTQVYQSLPGWVSPAKNKKDTDNVLTMCFGNFGDKVQSARKAGDRTRLLRRECGVAHGKGAGRDQSGCGRLINQGQGTDAANNPEVRTFLYSRVFALSHSKRRGRGVVRAPERKKFRQSVPKRRMMAV